jgi:hypothetical protein
MKSPSLMFKVDATNPPTLTEDPAPNRMPLGLTKNTWPLAERLPKMTEGSAPITRFNAIAAAVGMFSTVSPDEFTANLRRYQRFEAMGPGRDLLDPDSETNAAISRLRAGLSTLKIECAKRGLHWVRVMRQAKLENQLAAILGVKLDFSKGNGGQAAATNTREQGATTSA